MLDFTGGSSVNVASIFGLVGVGQMPQASYAASKGAIVSLTRELAAQWARRKIRVNAIAPGFFPSEMTGDMFDDQGSAIWLRRKIPMGRPGRIDEFDGALLLLASDAGRHHGPNARGRWGLDCRLAARLGLPVAAIRSSEEQQRVRAAAGVEAITAQRQSRDHHRIGGLNLTLDVRDHIRQDWRSARTVPPLNAGELVSPRRCKSPRGGPDPLRAR